MDKGGRHRHIRATEATLLLATETLALYRHLVLALLCAQYNVTRRASCFAVLMCFSRSVLERHFERAGRGDWLRGMCGRVMRKCWATGGFDKDKIKNNNNKLFQESSVVKQQWSSLGVLGGNTANCLPIKHSSQLFVFPL